MQIQHINNLISLIADTVDKTHKGDSSATVKALHHLWDNSEIYGDIPEEVYYHTAQILLAIDSELYPNPYEDDIPDDDEPI